MPKIADVEGLEKRWNTADPQEEAILTKVAEIRKAANLPFGDAESDAALTLVRIAGPSSLPVEKRAQTVAEMLGLPEVQKADAVKCAKCGFEMKSADAYCAKCGAKFEAKKAEEPTTIDDLLKSETPLAKAVADLLKSQGKQIESLTKQVGELTAKDTHTVSLKKAEETAIPTDREKIANVLQKAYAVSPEYGDEVFSLLKATGQIIKTADLFGEIGSGTPAEGSAEFEVEKRASALVAKSTTGLTKAKAIDQVLQDDPKLYSRYQAEKGAK